MHKKITVPRNEYCKPCNGTGAKNGTAMQNCATCQGQGQVITSSGFFRMQQTCPSCGGTGKTIKEFCPECAGKGMQKIKRNIDITIPKGVDNTSRLRVRHEGEIGRDGPGDLYLYIHVVPHELFKREGTDLYMDLPVSFVKATLGGEVSIPTLSGKGSIKIPEGTQSGKVFRLKGKGMPDLRTEHNGDLYAKVMIQVPQKMNAEQKRLIEEYAKISGEEIDQRGGSFTDKIKKVFK